MEEFRGRKRERTRWMKEGRIRKGAYKGDVARGSSVHLKSGTVLSLSPPPPLAALYNV
jgi:hypothetical protein